MPTMFDFSDCLDTEEGTRAEVVALEAELARHYGVEPSKLVELDDAGKLDDSPLVADWRATTARLASWTSGE
jgi:hypothetical protein